MHKQEEEFRVRDNERIAKYVGPSRFDAPAGMFGSDQEFPSPGGRDRSTPPAFAVHESAGETIAKGFGTSNLQSRAEVNVLEKKIARLEDKLNSAAGDLATKDQQLRMYKQWQSMEQAFAPGPDGTPVPQGQHPSPGMMEA